MNKWAGDTITLWTEHFGRFNLRQCANACAPPDATSEDVNNIIALVNERTSALLADILEEV